jgi:hypothetical protein
MKSLLFCLLLVAIFFFNNSNGQTTDDDQRATDEKTTTTRRYTNKSFFIIVCISLAWWTRTFPIVVTRTRQPRPNPPVRVTTPLNRVSNAVSIAVPVALFGVTIVFGFGLIIYAVVTGGGGRSFLTRTNQRSFA